MDFVREHANHQEAGGLRWGVEPICAVLLRVDRQAAHQQVERLMSAAGLVGARRGARKRTTIPDPAAALPSDLLDRDFSAPAPNRVWVTDFT